MHTLRTPRLGERLVAALTLFCFTATTVSPSLAWAAESERIAPAQVVDAAQAEDLSGSRDKPAELPEVREGIALETEKRAPEELKGALTESVEKTAAAGTEAPAAVADQTAALPTGGDKSGVTSQSISVPKGSGSIQGMGESFSAQLSTGIATFSVPFALPAARGGAQPSLGLSYSSGSGSGLAGMGWSVGVPFIARQTDRGVPGYDDRATWHANQDRFVFNGGQELVPICTVGAGRTCLGKLVGEEMPPWSVGHQYFRPRVEGSFLRFFWAPNHLTWRVQDKSGVTMELGVPLDGSDPAKNRAALEVNPDPSGREEIYRWRLVRQYDTYGGANPETGNPTPFNVVVYKYSQDPEEGQAYVTDIYDTTPAATVSTTDVSKYAHHTRLVWDTRSDPTESYRSGWPIQQTKRLARVDVTSKTYGGGESGARRLVRRYHLDYDRAFHTSLLQSVQVEGRCAAREEDAPAESNEQLPAFTGCEKLPPMQFEYSHVKGFTTAGTSVQSGLPGYEAFDERLQQIGGDPPHSVDEEQSDYFDVNSDGLADLLVTAPGTYGNDFAAFFNSAGGTKKTFGEAAHVGVQGVLGANSGSIKLSNLNVAPLDLDGDGTIDFLHMPKVKTYSVYTPKLKNGKWMLEGRSIASASGQNPKIDFGQDAAETRLVDVNFDGLVDVVVSTGKEFQTFLSLGRLPDGDGQFGHGEWASSDTSAISTNPISQCVPYAGTPLRFSDSDTQLADMNGDGIADIVRLRRGDIRYWPGRGNGFWGTGKRDDCEAGSFGDKRYLTMTEAPYYSDIQGTSLRMDDVNGDGLDDLVQVRFDAVDVWLNVDGKGWTKRHIIDGTPASPSYANRVRLMDINGSTTRDIVWGNGKKYQYIDLAGGERPHLLVGVKNGLGKSTAIEYAPSTDEMLKAEATGQACDSAGKPWASAWCTKMPTITHLVKRVTESDNLSVAGSGAGVYVTEYSYRDPVFEGRQREFRGFSKARSKRIGDANSPTDFTESTFLLGECEDETPNNGVDDCSVSERWRDNPKEALKGLPIITERYNEQGLYLSTEATTYRLRHLYTGLDGRAVRHAFESGKRTTLYDTTAATAAAATLALPLVELQRAPDPAFNPYQCPNPATVLAEAGLEPKSFPVPVRASAGTATTTSNAFVDYFGNRTASVARGCVAGDACPPSTTGVQPATGMVGDESICSFTEPVLPAGQQTGWLYRTGLSWSRGSSHVEEQGKSLTTYSPEGAPTKKQAWHERGVPLTRSSTSPSRPPVAPPPGVSANGYLTLAELTYDARGNLVQEKGANGRCRAVKYEAALGALAYGQFPSIEIVYLNGCPATLGDESTPALSTVASYDRGLGLVTSVIDMTREKSDVRYDAFGRLTQLFRPLPEGGTSTIPSVKVSYDLPAQGSARAYSVIHTESQDGKLTSESQYLESYSYVDGMGRSRVGLTEADLTEDGHPWIVSEIAEFDAKGAVRRKYLPLFSNAVPPGFPISNAPPDAPYGRQRYDAFGRQLQTFDIDGTVTLQSRYHALSTDLFDAADLYPGPHQGSYATTRTDGHGRTISTTERVHINGALEERHVRTSYLATGQPEVITRVRGSDKVVRWMRYDSLGRMVLNVDPHATVGFNESPATNEASLKTWRYAYNDSGDLIATADPRGCGQNFYYDGVGRLKAEEYSPCDKAHGVVRPLDFATGAGFEVFYEYDDLPDGVSTSPVAAPPGFDQNSDRLRGRLKAVHDRAATTWFKYDARGRSIQTSRKVSRIDAPQTTVAGRYVERWYQKDFEFDAADRPKRETTGAATTALLANDGTSAVTTEYTARGTIRKVGSSYGDLVTKISRTADGLVKDLFFGDAAATTTHTDYDSRRRLRSVQTYRTAADAWSTVPASITPAPGPEPPDPTRQLLLQDLDYDYDVVNNPIEIRDWRIADEWPDGAKPASRRMEYDDLNRVTRVDYDYPGGHDKSNSPYAPELSGQTDPRRPIPSGHRLFAKRPLWQTYRYDWLGNTTHTDDDQHAFWDRSLGDITNNSTGKPYQFSAASQPGAANPYNGSRTAPNTTYDAAGNLLTLQVSRAPANCAPGIAVCSSRYFYQWDEVGRLMQARRVEGSGPSSSGPWLDYLYDANDERVIKEAYQTFNVNGQIDTSAPKLTTLYVFDSLEIRRVPYDTVAQQYPVNANTEVAYLSGNGMRLARLHYEPEAKGEPRNQTSGALHTPNLHVMMNLPDHLGSSSLIIDHATGELVEARTYQPYGATESDYRPERWKGFREDYGFTGKEEDVEVGLQYFGKRFLSPYLGRWLSADPLAVHVPGRADLNLYAYVSGHVLRSIDPLGLAEKTPIGVNVTPEQQKQLGINEGDYFFIDPKGGSGTQKFTDLDSIRAEADERGVPVFQADSTSSRTIKQAVDFSEMIASIRSLLGGSVEGGEGSGGSCTGPACGTAKKGQNGAGGPTDLPDAVALAGGIAANETEAVEGGSDTGSPGGKCTTCKGSKTQQVAIGAGRVANLAKAGVDATGVGAAAVLTAGKHFKQHFVSHRALVERTLGIKVGKLKEGGGEALLGALGKAIDSGTLAHVGQGTLKKGGELMNIYRGNGLTVVTKPNGEWVTALKSGEGLDAAIRMHP